MEVVNPSEAMEVDVKKKKVTGWDVYLILPLHPMFNCPLCHLLIRDSVQTFRGERACESCYYDAKGDQDVCPIDHEPIKDGAVFKDMYARREILQLGIYCDSDNKRNGCNWQGVVMDILNHRLECQYKYVPCELCDDCVLRCNRDKHIADECLLRPLICSYCKDVYQAQDMKEHAMQCQKRPVECPYLCGEEVNLVELYNHVPNCCNIVNCTQCPYQPVGCQWRYALGKDDLQTHMDISVHTHAALAICNVEFLKNSNQKMTNDLITEKTRREELSQKIESNWTEKTAMISQIKNLEEKISDVRCVWIKTKESIDKGVEKVKGDLEEINTRTEVHSLKQINEKLETMAVQINNMETKVRSSQPMSIVSRGGNPDDVQNSLHKIDEIESHSAVMGSNLADLELKLQLLENTAYDGRQLWKIDNVDYRRSQAVTGKVTALHSAPWYLRRGEYKFCARLYLNGDGLGRGTHVSLFFVLMKSEYDSLLKWPFGERVTFRLVNPYNRDDSKEESFIPDSKSSSFQQPTREMNIAAGCPNFIKKTELNKYIVNDAIFIEIEVLQKKRTAIGDSRGVGVVGSSAVGKKMLSR